MSSPMRLKMIRTLWGVWKMADGPHEIEAVVPLLRKLGYEGLEAPMCFPLAYGVDKFKQLLSDNEMMYVPMLFTSGPVCPGVFNGGFDGHSPDGRDVKQHIQVFKEQARAAYDLFPDTTKFCNSHSGNDYFTLAEADEFFGAVLEFQKTEGLEVYHETHRKRWLHSPWVTRDFLPRHPELKVVADLSHWVCVAETDTNDPELEAAIELLAPRVHHIHARVGYDHGPQVADPRAPEWMPYTEGHESWWKKIWDEMAKRGDEWTTVTPEHGPPNYQQTIPHTRIPTAEIWDVNHFIGLRSQRNFAEKFGEANTSKLVPSESQGETGGSKFPWG